MELSLSGLSFILICENEGSFLLITISSSFILGERMKHRCTATTDTVCAPCQDEYFSSEHNHKFCNSCTVCNTSKSFLDRKLGSNQSYLCTFLRSWCLSGCHLRRARAKTGCHLHRWYLLVGTGERAFNGAQAWTA